MRRIVLMACLTLCAGSSRVALSQPDTPFRGMDESVNEALAEQAGRPGRDPLIDTESWGELWNLLLLAAGGACGFIVGRFWDQIWGRRPPPGPGSESGEP